MEIVTHVQDYLKISESDYILFRIKKGGMIRHIKSFKGDSEVIYEQEFDEFDDAQAAYDRTIDIFCDKRVIKDYKLWGDV